MQVGLSYTVHVAVECIYGLTPKNCNKKFFNGFLLYLAAKLHTKNLQNSGHAKSVFLLMTSFTTLSRINTSKNV